MATCPICGAGPIADGQECPRCHLSASLFTAVREAAGPDGDTDPAYVRTIGELLATVDQEGGLSTAPAASPPSLARRPPPSAARPRAARVEAEGATHPPARRPPEIARVVDLPPVPPSPTGLADARRRVEEYFRVARRLDLDFTDFHTRANSAALAGDTDSLEVLAREMFVHLSSAVVEEYESLLARRNELAQLFPTSGADVELTAVRRAIGVGDLGGAQRRLSTVRDELASVEQSWEVGRILVAEGELLVATLRELGGDPSPATGPLEEGRKLFAAGRRADAERLLARAAVALWTLLKPLLLADLHRLRDRIVEERSAGLDIEPAVREMRAVSAELRKRNFVGMILAYRRLRSEVERAAPSEVGPVVPGAATAAVRSPHSA
ncbi:MAG: hypothetical protein ACRECT_03055 [Thermoplasmata archaeon]